MFKIIFHQSILYMMILLQGSHGFKFHVNRQLFTTEKVRNYLLESVSLVQQAVRQVQSKLRVGKVDDHNTGYALLFDCDG